MEDTENSPPLTPDLPPSLSIEAVISGLASDLESLRQGRISVQQAQAAANLGKQVFNGMKLVVTARKMLSSSANELPLTDGDNE
jgi:hypothetical protein